MSLGAIFAAAAARLGRTTWGSKITGADGVAKDTGVNQFAQELMALLGSNEPIEVREPIRFVKKHSGPLFNVVYGQDDSSPLARFYRDNEEVSQVAPTTQDAAQETTSSVTQTITNAIGSLYRVAAIGENGIVTLDEIDASGNATGTQIQARSVT